MNKKRLFQIRFQNNLYHNQIEAFRGAIINSLQNKDILFHNHLPEQNKLRYSYPLIQYKIINNKAAILCLDVGTETIGKLFMESDFDLNLNGEKYLFIIDNIKAYHHTIQIWDSRFHYHLHKWMPLNQENYNKYNELESVTEKSQFLENILLGNILSFAKGLNIFFDQQVACKITWMSDPTVTPYKGVLVTLFDVEFITNVSIPNYAGLGKGVSIGYGTTVGKRKKMKVTNNI